MKVTTTQATLNAALSKLQGAVSAKATISELSCVKIKAAPEGKGASFLGTNIDLTVKAKIECEVEAQEGETLLVPYRLLAGIVENAVSGIIELEGKDGGNLTVETATGISKITMQPSSGFPVIDRDETETRLSVPCEDLRTMLSQTKFAAAKPNEARKTLISALMSVGTDETVCVAANGRCLARVICKGVSGAASNIDIILPQASVAELLRFANNDESVDILIPKSRGYAVFVFADAVVKTRLIDDTFPNWKVVIPKGDGDTVVTNATGLVSAIRRASVFLSSVELQYITLCIDGDEIVVSSPEAGIGQIKETVKTEGFSGKGPISINFDKTLLTDALSAANAEKVTLHFYGEANPLCITDEKRYLGIVMPMKIA